MGQRREKNQCHHLLHFVLYSWCWGGITIPHLRIQWVRLVGFQEDVNRTEAETNHHIKFWCAPPPQYFPPNHQIQSAQIVSWGGK